MKNLIILIGLAALLVLSSCTKNPATAGSPEGEASLVITQPKDPASITPVLEVLRQALTRTAESSNGAHVPCPQISVLLPDGKLAGIDAPNVDGGLFGSTSPKARQARLEGLMAALEARLTAGCGGETVDLQLLKDHQTRGLRPGPFSVWAAAGGDNPWAAGEKECPQEFFEDRSTFSDRLSGSHGQSANFLVVSDAMPTAISRNGKKRSTEIPVVVPATPPTLSPATDKVAIEKTLAMGEPKRTVVTEQRGGDTFIVDVKNYPSSDSHQQKENPDSSGERGPSVSLPSGVVPLGDEIHFATNSAKLDPNGFAVVARAAAIVRTRGETSQPRLFLVAKADYRNAEFHNENLSRKRGEAVQAAFLAERISIEKIIAVGESLSPDSGDSKMLAGQRSVQIWMLPDQSVNRKDSASEDLNVK